MVEAEGPVPDTIISELKRNKTGILSLLRPRPEPRIWCEPPFGLDHIPERYLAAWQALLAKWPPGLAPFVWEASICGQIGRELDRLELLLGQIKAAEAERDALLTPATETEGMPGPQAMLIDLRGSRVRPVIPTKAQPAAWFPGTPNMALKGGGILPGLWSRWHSHRWGSGRRRQTKTPVADFFKDGDRTNFLRVHRTQGRRGFWRRQFPRAFRVDRSGSDRTRRARRVNYQGEIAVHYLLTEMQKSIAQSSSSPRL